ncbi:MAG: carbon-nitrogen family hydrolase [Schwartzia sp. (in: firmicutes)]
MKISILQMPVVIGGRAENIASLRRMMEKASKEEPDVVLLPELWDIGFLPWPMKRYGDPEGEMAKAALRDLAMAYGVNIVGGSVAAAATDRVANRCFVYDRGGTLVASYDKTHLFSAGGEGRVFAPGAQATTFLLDGVRCAVIICYDLRFPELVRRLAEENISVLFLPAQWPTVREMHWRVLTQARAIENQIFVAAANGSGAFANGLPLAGRSVILDPWGERLAEAQTGEAILTADCDMAVREKIRREIDVFADRRPELYG